jgi:hypothetical protein
MLPTKLASIKLTVFEKKPEELLGRCWVVAELFAAEF